MMDLKLFNSLTKNDMATIVFQEQPGDKLNYYMVSGTLGYNVITHGICDGKINKPILSLSVRISTLVPLVTKGIDFEIRYRDDTLMFVHNPGSNELVIKPVAVECLDESSSEQLNILFDFIKEESIYSQRLNKITALESKLKDLTERRESLKILNLSGGPSENPFGTWDGDEKFDDKYNETVAKLTDELTALKKEQAVSVTPISLAGLRTLAIGAARTNSFVNLCTDFGVVDLQRCYLFERTKCPSLSITGNLLNLLLMDGGSFFEFRGSFVYRSTGPTFVFIKKFMPNAAVDMSLVNRGKILEHYFIDTRDIIPIVATLASKYQSLVFDMGAGKIILSNEEQETVEYKFSVNDAKTVALNKFKRDPTQNIDLSMAKITVPPIAIRLLSLFRGEIDIFVKDTKIIFRKNTTYLVFGR